MRWGVRSVGSRGDAGDDRRRLKGRATQLAILEAARELLAAGGPEAVRLQEVARRAHVSHSTVLHHFGSRLRLVKALAQHVMEGLHRDMIAAITPRTGLGMEQRVERTHTILERVSEVYADRGYARLIAGILLADDRGGPRREDLFAPAPAAMHAARVERRRSEALPLPAREDTLLGFALVGVALFGDALYGPIMRGGIGLPAGPEGAAMLRRWLAQVLEAIPPFIVEPDPRAPFESEGSPMTVWSGGCACRAIRFEVRRRSRRDVELSLPRLPADDGHGVCGDRGRSGACRLRHR